MANHVKGIIAARKAFQAVEPVMRAKLAEATERTVYAVERRAVQNVPTHTGTLRQHIGSTFSKRSGFGKVGIRPGRVVIAGTGGSAFTKHGARVLEPRKYAHFVEFGTSDIQAQPFMLPAAQAERVAYAQRLKASGAEAERDLSRIGGGLL